MRFPLYLAPILQREYQTFGLSSWLCFFNLCLSVAICISLYYFSVSLRLSLSFPLPTRNRILMTASKLRIHIQSYTYIYTPNCACTTHESDTENVSVVSRRGYYYVLVVHTHTRTTIHAVHLFLDIHTLASIEVHGSARTHKWIRLQDLAEWRTSKPQVHPICILYWGAL